jgi:hypothetical protein
MKVSNVWAMAGENSRFDRGERQAELIKLRVRQAERKRTE